MKISSMTGGLMALAMILLGIMVNAFTVWALWGWFAVPLGVSPIGIIHAFGLALLVSFMTKEINEGTREPTERFFLSLARAGLALGLGGIAHLLM